MEWKQGAKNLTPYNAELINNEGREKLGHVQVAMQMSIWVIHCYPVLTDLRSAIIYLLYDLALASSINGHDSSSVMETVASKLRQTIPWRKATVSLDNKTLKRSLAVHFQSYPLAFAKKEQLATVSA